VSEHGRVELRSAWRWMLSVGLVTLAAPTLLTACTSIRNSRSSSSAAVIDFSDVWTATDFPCGAGKLDLVLSVNQLERELIATSLTTSTCTSLGHVVWHGTLPQRGITAAALPLTVQVELTVQARQAEVARTIGVITLISADRMVLAADTGVVELTRAGKSSDASIDARGGPSLADSGKDGGAELDSGMHGGSSEPANPAPERAEDPDAPAANGGGTGAGKSGTGGAAAVSGRNASGPAGANASAQAGVGGIGGGGAAGTAPAAGAGVSPEEVIESLKGIYWFCINVDDACVCIENTDSTNDFRCRSKPRECCVTSPHEDVKNCQCAPATSLACQDALAEPDRVMLDRCPP
jgi:hypothetical protein